MNRQNSSRMPAMAALAFMAAVSVYAAEVRRLTLTEAVHLAISQNRALKIARLKVTENEQKKAGERSAYFPTITNQSNALHITDLQNIEIPAGAFGTSGGNPHPGAEADSLPQGQNDTCLQRHNDCPAAHAVDSDSCSQPDCRRRSSGFPRRPEEGGEPGRARGAYLYFGILIARLQKQAAEQQSAYAREHLRESEEDVRNGSALRVASIQGRAGVLESQQAVLTADLQLADLTTELNDLLGLPLDTRLELDPAVPASPEQRPREEYVQTAWSENPEILAAEEAVRKARAGVTAAKSAYIPDITAYARHSYQDGVPFLVRNFGTFGVNLNWDVFDFGKRRAVVARARSAIGASGRESAAAQGRSSRWNRAKLQQSGANQESGRR